MRDTVALYYAANILYFYCDGSLEYVARRLTFEPVLLNLNVGVIVIKRNFLILKKFISYQKSRLTDIQKIDYL